MINTLNDFIREYKKIVDMGWIRTHRAGPTGIGKTLEDLLGIVENNIDGTLSPLPRGANTTLRVNYGYSSEFYDNYEKVLHATLSGDRFTRIADTGHSLKFTCKTDGIYIESENGVENIYWSRENLKKQFEKKYKNKFVYAKADSRGNGVDEEFLFKEAWEVSGFNYDSFIKMLEDGKIYVDLRIGQYHGGSKDGKTHDHGTVFRIREYDQQFLFTINKKIV